MAKPKNYFSHDYHARGDLRNIRKDMGLEGVGLYWCLIEILHENGGSIKLSELDGIAYELQISAELCEKLIRDYDKFTLRNEKITCNRVTKNLKKREEISRVRQAAANERWCVEEKNEAVTDIEWYKNWFSEKLDERESKAGVYDSIWRVRSYLENILESLSEQKTVTIEHKKISIEDYFKALQFFVWSEDRMRRFVEVIDNVNERTGIKNKQKYLISALYLAAKTNGG